MTTHMRGGDEMTRLEIAVNKLDMQDVVLGEDGDGDLRVRAERNVQAAYAEEMEDADAYGGNYWYEPISTKKEEIIDEIRATEEITYDEDDDEIYHYTYNGKRKTIEDAYGTPSDEELLEAFLGSSEDSAIFDLLDDDIIKVGVDYAVEQFTGTPEYQDSVDAELRQLREDTRTGTFFR